MQLHSRFKLQFELVEAAQRPIKINPLLHSTTILLYFWATNHDGEPCLGAILGANMIQSGRNNVQ